MRYELMPYVAGLVIVVALVLMIRLWLTQRHRAELQATLRAAMERGENLTPELTRAIGIRPASSDLRRGVIHLCIAAGIVFYGFLDHLEGGPESSILTFIGIAVFPALTGTVLITFHFLERNGR